MGYNYGTWTLQFECGMENNSSACMYISSGLLNWPIALSPNTWLPHPLLITPPCSPRSIRSTAWVGLCTISGNSAGPHMPSGTASPMRLSSSDSIVYTWSVNLKLKAFYQVCVQCNFSTVHLLSSPISRPSL